MTEAPGLLGGSGGTFAPRLGFFDILFSKSAPNSTEDAQATRQPISGGSGRGRSCDDAAKKRTATRQGTTQEAP
jgi:hypothetical protein